MVVVGCGKDKLFLHAIVVVLPEHHFNCNKSTYFGITLNTTFSNFTKFTEECVEEKQQFFIKYQDRIKYLGNGEYEVFRRMDELDELINENE